MAGAASRAGSDVGESGRATALPGRDGRPGGLGGTRRAPGSPGRDERWGVWGAISGPPILNESAELLYALSGFPEHVVGLRKTEADLGAAELGVGVERRARHGGHAAFLDQPHRERVVVVHAGRLHEVGGVGEDVVRAARLPRDEAGRLDVAPEEVAALLVALAQTDVVRVREPERGDRRLLERMRRADGDEVVGAADTDRELRRRHRVANSPAGDGR